MPDAESALPDPLRNRIWCIGSIEFDESRRELRVGGQIRLVEAKPLLLLETLLARAGDVVRKEELLAIVWQDRTVVEQSLTTAVSKLRAALGDEGRAIIEAVHGVGYRIGMPIELRAAPERPRLAFAFQAGDPVPNRPQWCLDRPLGPGRARDVWLAVHSKTGERRVFKFADTTQRLDALRREAALSRILYKALGDRPDLVRISEWNFDTRPFFIESPFGGDSIADWATAHGGITAIPLVSRIAIVARIARTVADAHDVGVLHRDIKPANILVSGDSNDIAVRLVDFGSGRLTEAAVLEAVTIEGLGLTDASTDEVPGVSGTLRYIAPEIIAGGAPTIAADVYAIGILLYQMIVGDLDRPLGAGWEADIADPLLRDDVRDAASSDAKRRLASALVLAERLESLEKRRAAHDRVERIEREASRLAQQLERARARRPWLIFGVVSLALGLFVTAVFAIRTSRARDEALRQSNITKQVNDFLTEDLLGRAKPGATEKSDETLTEAASRAEAYIDTRFENEPLVAAKLHLAMAIVFDKRSNYAPARVAYSHAIDDFVRAQGPASPDATIARLREAVMEGLTFEAGSTARANALISFAQMQFPGLGARSAEASVWLSAALGMIEMAGGDVRKGLALFKEAADIADTMPDNFDESRRLSLRQREAFAHLRLGEFDAADKILSRLLPRQIALHGPNHPDTLVVELTQAITLTDRGSSAQALDLLDRLEPEFVAVYGANHRLTLSLYANRAQALSQLERYADAARDDMHLYRAATKKQGEQSWPSVGSLTDVAEFQCRAGSVADGLVSARHAYDVARTAFGASDTKTQAVSGTLAFCLILDKHYADAERLLDGADLQRVSQLIADPDYTAEVALMKADIALSNGNKALAGTLLQPAEKAFETPSADPFLRRWTSRLATLQK